MIKSLTEQLVEASNGIIHIEPEVSDPTGPYSCFDSGATEVEVSEFLWGFVRALKPKNVLTTGVYTGVSDLYIAQALKDNGFGHSTALEIENTHKLRAERLWQACGVAEYVTCHLQYSLDFKPEGEYDFIFLDSEPQIRFAELEKFFPYLKPGGFIGIHDLPNTLCQGNINPDHPEMKSYPYGDVPNQMRAWMDNGQLVKFHLPTPRGITFFYKPTEEDYR